jgi:hypothetical protein
MIKGSCYKYKLPIKKHKKGDCVRVQNTGIWLSDQTGTAALDLSRH